MADPEKSMAEPPDAGTVTSTTALSAASAATPPATTPAAAPAAAPSTTPEVAPPVSSRPSSSGEKEKIPAADDDSSSPSPAPLAQADSHKPPAAGDPTPDPYRNLDPAEAAILKAQTEIPEVPAGLGKLYAYATRWDIVILIVSIIVSIIAGIAMPLMPVIFANLQNSFANFYTGRLDKNGLVHDISRLVLFFIYLAIGMFVATYLATVGFIYTGEHITAKVRAKYLESALRQNIGFFDSIGAGEITTRITADTNLVQDGISEKVSLTITAIATFVSAIVIGFISYWKLTLICSTMVVAIFGLMAAASSFIVRYSKESSAAYARGGSLAEEVISSIRNAVAFGTQDRLARQYEVHLLQAEKYGFRVKVVIGCMLAGLMCLVNILYFLAWKVGSRFIVDGSTSLKDLLIVALATLIGAFTLGNIAPNIQAFGSGLSAWNKIYQTINRSSPIDPASTTGLKPEHVTGHIRLEGIKHIYPSRPDVVVCDNVTLDIPAGKTTALVGASGSGKSTIVGLIEAFYSPVKGRVLLDGHDLSQVNLRWLRSTVSLVAQEPTLFATTIRRNIWYGLIGSRFENETPEQQEERIINAAKKANAHDFISSLPDGFDTNVGERGFLLSGGQKQRIAIARAIVSEPAVILLDEPTSALDSKSEGVVMAALDAAAAGRTTITIAHRLSTIRDADQIVVMAAGRIVEIGTHNELLDKGPGGAYYDLVNAQKLNMASDQDEVAPDDAAAAAEEDARLTNLARAYSREKGFIPDPDHSSLPARLDRLDRTATAKSQSSVALARIKSAEAKEKPRKYSLWTLLRFLASFNREDWVLMLLGLAVSIVCGGINPTQAVVFAHLINELSRPLDSTAARIRLLNRANFWSLMYVMLAVVALFSFSLQGIFFAKCSERLIRRCRDRAFRAFLRQDIAFFDKDENTAGALTSFLSTETTHLAGLSGSTLGAILMVLTTLIASMALSLAIGWKLALVCISTIPVLFVCGFFRFWMLAHFQNRSKKAYNQSASYASEAVSAIRTVAALTREQDVLADYERALNSQQRASLKSILKSSALYAASQSLVFLVFGLGFWYGGTLIANREYTLFSFFIVLTAIIFGAQSAGIMFSFAPDMGKAAHAADELKTLFDRKPAIDTWSDKGDSVPTLKGALELRNVHFRYPTRPDTPVLRGLDLVVHPGQYVALVGASGCGKSSALQLICRFYDVLAGQIVCDGRDVRDLNVNEYRANIALVSQEPTLYQGTIRENIKLGTANESVSEADIEAACKKANILDFIRSLPDGFNTLVGSKGVLLSGGQKQRIAIARALVRNPALLLLDEATAALDSESEKVVQDALDAAADGRTTIAVAHRLSTIQRASIIYVLDAGRVVEKGTHHELLAKGGKYAELVRLQSLEKY